MENNALLILIKILQENAKDEGIDTDLVKDIYNMEKTTLSSETHVDVPNLRQKILIAMSK